MTEFHPSLFRRKCRAEGPADMELDIKPAPIPQNTLYEEPLVSQHRVKKRYVTVYGFTPANLEAVLDMIRSCGDILEIEYGKNWVNVLFGGEEGIKKCLRMNTSIVGEEMIGVFRQGGGVVDDKDIFVRHKGVFTSIMEYFFGD
ncbi:hypothetical protein HK407_02g03390 [Ordospora pajunii]|jgi:hypothetical protein|uniref:uncharacterized protein n=1 Tax=Ordospora pajunii TaxID=3039483 RepID=UPI0029528856|nr:uncharacterized protein HK407_02g03390 [Ordospora pajunii]KAH9411895.1 hypothetical protein HK407_02g03390 [Ordospora pajunii]